MNKSLVTLGLAVAICGAQAQPAQAIKKEWSAVAGFVGGVLVANAAHCNRSYSYQPAPVVYHQAPTIVYETQPTYVVRHRPEPSGYYEWRTERVWVPGCWVYEDNGCGYQRKVWQSGYYKTNRHKVWVSAGRSCDW